VSQIKLPAVFGKSYVLPIDLKVGMVRMVGGVDGQKFAPEFVIRVTIFAERCYTKGISFNLVNR